MHSSNLRLLLQLLKVNMHNRIVAIENTSNLFQSRALGLHVEEEDEEELTKVPEGVEEHKVPVVGEVVPRKLVGLAIVKSQQRLVCKKEWQFVGVDVLSNSKNSLYGNVHDGHTLGTEMEGQNLKRVGDKEAGETNVVEDAEEPDKDDLGVTGGCVSVFGSAAGRVGSWGRWDTRVLVDGTNDSPADEGDDHAGNGCEEEWATTDFVDGEGGADGDDEIENGFAGGQLCRISMQVLNRGDETKERALMVLQQVSCSAP